MTKVICTICHEEFETDEDRDICHECMEELGEL